MSRIKIRVSAGVFEVSLLRVIDESKSIEVLWDRGIKREFKWGSVVFGHTDGQTVMQKPFEPAPERERDPRAVFDLSSRVFQQRCPSRPRLQPLRFTLHLFRLPHNLPLAPPHLDLHPCIRLLIFTSPLRQCTRPGPGPTNCANLHRSRCPIRSHTPSPGITPQRCKRRADRPPRVRVHRARTALHCNGSGHTPVQGTDDGDPTGSSGGPQS